MRKCFRPATMVAIVVLLIAALAAAVVAASPSGAAAKAEANTTAYNLYFGDLHAHTDYSDSYAEGSTPEDAFKAAKAGGADFFATTDHAHYGYGTGWLTPSRWAETLAVADRLTDKDFVAIAGYELWLPAVGELNIYNTTEIFGETGNPGDHGYNNGIHESIYTVLPSLYDWLAETGAVAQWNHPGAYGAQGGSPLVNFFHFAWYTPTRDQGVCLLENLRRPTYEAAYIEALDAGWHVMPAANSDTHQANWITGSEVRTVLLSEQLTRDDLFEAMRASRGYATRDMNLEIRYTLDGAVMGSVLSPKVEYEAAIHIVDPDGADGDPITAVEIVSDGGVVVDSTAVNSHDVEWTITLPSDDEHYFYVRVTTASKGPSAWTAPVWTGR